MFYNVLVRVSLCCVYQVTEAIQAMAGTRFGG